MLMEIVKKPRPTRLSVVPANAASSELFHFARSRDRCHDWRRGFYEASVSCDTGIALRRYPFAVTLFVSLYSLPSFLPLRLIYWFVSFYDYIPRVRRYRKVLFLCTTVFSKWIRDSSRQSCKRDGICDSLDFVALKKILKISAWEKNFTRKKSAFLSKRDSKTAKETHKKYKNQRMLCRIKRRIKWKSLHWYVFSFFFL